MRLARFNDWPSRLMAAVDKAKDRPFEWGSSDCCLFACDCIQAMTGTDPAAHFRGRYKTAPGARRSLKAFAGAGLEAAVERITTELRMPEVPVPMAQRGDVLLVHAPGCGAEELALAVCIGGGIAAQGPEGLTVVPLAQGRRAWRV